MSPKKSPQTTTKEYISKPFYPVRMGPLSETKLVRAAHTQQTHLQFKMNLLKLLRREVFHFFDVLRCDVNTASTEDTQLPADSAAVTKQRAFPYRLHLFPLSCRRVMSCSGLWKITGRSSWPRSPPERSQEQAYTSTLGQGRLDDRHHHRPCGVPAVLSKWFWSSCTWM